MLPPSCPPLWGSTPQEVSGAARGQSPSCQLCTQGLGSRLRRVTYKDPVEAKPLIASGKGTTRTSLPWVPSGSGQMGHKPFAQWPWETCFCLGGGSCGNLPPRDPPNACGSLGCPGPSQPPSNPG